MKLWKKRGLAFLLGATMLLSMAGCGSEEKPEVTPTVAPTATTAPVATTAPTAEPTATTAPTATPEPTATPIPEPTATPVPTEAPFVSEAGSVAPFRVLTAEEIVTEMGTGWNLGNTMDGHTGFTPAETCWQSVVTTKELMTTVHDAGFNTVRIPVTWGNMIDDANGYAINEKWLNRVQEIVDYCVSQDMYAIINIHHDGAEQTGWLRVGADDPQPVYEKFEAVWKQIAERFKDYDEHLIFESMNEVTGGDDSTTGIKRDMEVIMNLNQIFVDTVRATGSNNTERWLSVPARYTNITNTCKDEYGFAMPEDPAGADHLFLAVHYYDWTFGLQDNMGVTSWTLDKSKNVETEFKMLEKFTSQGYPVILGEYGAVDKNNQGERAYHFEVVNYLCEKYNVVPCIWDQGWYDHSKEVDYSFTMFDRSTGEMLYPELISAILRGTFVENKGGLGSIAKPAEVTAVTDFTLDAEQLSLQAGDIVKVAVTGTTPEKNNDVIVWKTADDSVATVYNGQIQAKGIGVTTVTAYSFEGKAEKTIEVVVVAATSDKPVTKIGVATGVVSLVQGQKADLGASMTPADTDAFLTYVSTDETVFTVNDQGIVTGTGTGTAYAIITASTGLTKSVKVKVSGVADSGELRVALNAYYTDQVHQYFGNDVGQPVTITGDGQYTVVFDCATDLSGAATAVGVESLAGVGSIYIKDHAVTMLEATKTPVTSCQIRYDKILLDGVELTITNPDFKEAMKGSGVLDTGDPVNAWDGSSVAEATANSDFTISFAGNDAPKKIEVTFTLSGLTFESVATEEAVKVNSLKAEESAVTMKAGETKEVKINVDPVNTTEGIAFMTGDASVAVVETAAVDPVDGVVIMKITALKAGKVTVTAMGEGTAKAKVEVTVE